MSNIKMFFDKIKENTVFLLVDPDHPTRFYAGLDINGRKSLVIKSEFKPKSIQSTNSIHVAIGKTNNNDWTISFALENNELSDIFFKFCDDIIDTSKSIENTSISLNYIIQRYNQWKKFFYKTNKNLLSEMEIMGLIGELLFLQKCLIPIFGLEDSLNSWTGWEKTHKDFSLQDKWFEIKSTKFNSLTVRISSLEQLDADIDGILVVYEFEKMSEQFDGISLNTLVRDVVNILPNSLVDDFLNKLKEIGYGIDEYYDKFVYRLVSKKGYTVSDSFPRLRKKQLPPSIVKVEYDILKRDLIDFEVKI